MTAQASPAPPQARSPKRRRPLLHLEHVSKQFGGVKALDDVRFDVMRGEVLCLAGENGCGKSTLIKIISGVHQPEKRRDHAVRRQLDRRAQSRRRPGPSASR